VNIASRAAIVVVLSLVAAACSSQPLTMAEYVDEMETATDAYIAESQALSEAFQATVTDQISEIPDEPDTGVEAEATNITKREIVQYMVLLDDAMTRYVEALVEIDAPSEVLDAHEQYLAAVAATAEAVPDARSAIGSASSLSGIQVALADSDFKDGQFRLVSSCVTLETVVRAEGLGIDLGCASP